MLEIYRAQHCLLFEFVMWIMWKLNKINICTKFAQTFIAPYILFVLFEVKIFIAFENYWNLGWVAKLENSNVFNNLELDI